MKSWQHEFRYVAEGRPTLLQTFEEELEAEAARVEEKPGTLLRWYGIRCGLPKLRKMLRHEVMLPAHVFIPLVQLCRLTYAEATARLWANAPPEKIAAHVQVRRRIAALYEAQRRMPCRRILCGPVVPQLVPTDRIYWK